MRTLGNKSLLFAGPCWAVRELRICIRSMESLPPAARRLAEHLKAA